MSTTDTPTGDIYPGARMCPRCIMERCRRAELELSSQRRDALAVVLMASGDRLADAATEAAVIRAERDALRLLLRAIYDQTVEVLEPDEDDTVTFIRRGRGHTAEEDWQDALRTIRDRIDKLLPWATEKGESYEETWLRLGYRVEWSEQPPRAYEVRKVGCCPSDGNCLVRLRTVREVDEWIRRSGR